MPPKTKTNKSTKPAASVKAAPASKPAVTTKAATAADKPVANAKATSPDKPVAVSKPAEKAKPVVRATPAASPAKVVPAPVKPAAKPAVATPAKETQEITFTYFAPQAGSVLVAGDFTKWEASPIRLVKEQTGHWKTTVALRPGKYQYRLLVDGEWQNDPGCAELQPNAFGSTNCILSVAA